MVERLVYTFFQEHFRELALFLRELLRNAFLEGKQPSKMRYLMYSSSHPK